jgi:hypothetical protein
MVAQGEDKKCIQDSIGHIKVGYPIKVIPATGREDP